MKSENPAMRLGLAAAALLVAAPAVALAGAPPPPAASRSAAPAPAAKRFTFTTKSEEARKAVEEAVRKIESFQGGPALLPLAQRAVEADPSFAFAHYLVAVSTAPPPAGQPHFDKAVELAKAASDGERRYLEAVGYLRAQQPDKALPVFQALAKDYPDERMVQMMLGQVNFTLDHYPDARAAFERAIRLDGTTPRAYSFLGNVYLMENNYRAAREQFQKAIDRKPPKGVPFQAYYGLAYSYVYEGNIQPAIDTLQAFEKVYTEAGGFPGLPAVFIYNSIARLYLENGKPDVAITWYEKGYQTVPGSSLADQEKMIWLGRLHHGKGRSYSKLGKKEEAWKEAETIKQMIEQGGERGKEFWPSYHYIAGYLSLEDGKYADAIEHLKQAHADDVFHRLLLARAYERSGDDANAQAIYREIVNSTTLNLERAIAYPEAKRKLKT